MGACPKYDYAYIGEIWNAWQVRVRKSCGMPC